MKAKNIRIISFAVICAAAFSFYALRSVPVSRIWNSYAVACVDKTADEETVLSYLARFGCGEVISLGQQRVPLATDIVPLLPESCRSYLTDRLGYFFDYSRSFLLYYIPQGSSLQAQKALELLSRELHVSAGIDGKQQLPFAAAAVSAAVFCFFLYFSRNRLVFFLSAVFAVALCVSKPFYPVAAASVLYMLSCYLAQRLWRRRKALSVLKKSPYVLIPAAVSVAAAAGTGWQCAVLAVLAVISSVLSLFLLREAQLFFDSRISFRPVAVFSAPQLVLMHPQTALHTLLCLVPLLLLLFCFLFTARFSPAADKGLTLPVPVAASYEAAAGSILPSIDDFYSWAWNVQAFPYRRLNSAFLFAPPQEGQQLTVPRFEETDGRIVQSDSLIMKFNSEFRSDTDRKIDSLEYGAIEKLMKRQGEGIRAAYAPRGNARQQPDSFSLILILCCLFVPVALLAVYAVKSSRKR